MNHQKNKLWSVIILTLMGFASTSFAQSTLWESDRKEAAAFAKQWAEDFIWMHEQVGHSGASGIPSLATDEEIKNIKCRLNCLQVVFEEELRSQNISESCVLSLSWAEWERWTAVLDKPALKEDSNTKLDPVPARFMKWLGRILDPRPLIKKVKTQLDQDDKMLELLSKPCGH